MPEDVVRKRSFFEELGFSPTIAEVCKEIRELYLADETPWVIGYSGGKDSTAVTQLVWLALADLTDKQRTKKPVYVITTDTLVENPIVAGWVRSSLHALKERALANELPFHTELLEPPPADSYWVNLIGKGYPAPRPGFRWCTERLKIKPTSRFIENTASRYGEAILPLGARKAESSARSGSLNRREKLSKEGLTAHPELVSTLVYAPIQDWSNDDVWTFLMRSPNPWGISNKDLMVLYRGATEDNECPIVVDTSTPSCGNSRFGCWVCTLVDQDKSMKAMIQNDVDKSWMRPLLELRNELDFRGDAQREKELARRDFRRLHGSPQLNRTRDALIPGPYTQPARAEWLEKLLKAQMTIRRNPDAPQHVKEIELISQRELRAIRAIWLTEKHEVEDLLPKVVESITGEAYVDVIEETPVLDGDALGTLAEAASGDRLHYETLRNLLDIEHQFRKGGTAVARRGLFKELQSTIESGFFADRADALRWALGQHQAVSGHPDNGPDFRVQRPSEESADRNGEGTSGFSDAASLEASEMLLERLLVENLGVFRGEHSIDLLPTNPKRPIVLVGALNGSGKTTVIEALQLALYGRRAGYGWRGTGSYSAYLEQVRNRHATVLENTVAELTLRLADGRRLRVRRQWSFSKKLTREYLSVYLNGSEAPDMALSEGWDEEVERLLPARLSELFFFDGERIEKLADPAQSASVLRAAVASLLGLDLVDHLVADLDILRMRQKQRLLSEADNTKLETLNEQYGSGSQKREDVRQAKAALAAKLDQAMAERDLVDRTVRDQGGDLFHQREQLASDVAAESGRLAALEQQLRHVAAGALPLRLVEPVLTQLRDEVESANVLADPRTHAALRLYLDGFRKWVKGRRYSARIKKELDRYAAQASEDLTKNGGGNTAFDSERVHLRLSGLLSSGLEESREATWSLTRDVATSAERLHVLEERLRQVPEQEQLAAILRAQGAAEASVSALTAEVAQLDQHLQSVERSLHAIHQQRQQLLERVAESEDARRTSDYCQRATRTLATFRTDLVQRRREQLERLILEAFQLLSRKGDLVHQVKLDNETMAVSLISTDGQALMTQQLSAGERQLLAVSMLWGLAKASGRPVPVVIDTPLGRLDGEHRRTLVERYFPDASHQVILLSTDQEVDADFSQLLDDSVAHRYLIDYSEARRSSSFSPGYFGG